MELGSYVERVREQVLSGAGAGGAEAREVAERLVATLDAASRLALLDALSAAADEITRELAPGSVDLRLRRGEPEFVVAPPPGGGDDWPVAGGDAKEVDADEGPTVRINLRLPERLKARIDEAAERQGRSANAWLVRAATAALRADERPDRPATGPGKRQYSGWVR